MVAGASKVSDRNLILQNPTTSTSTSTSTITVFVDVDVDVHVLVDVDGFFKSIQKGVKNTPCHVRLLLAPLQSRDPTTD